MSAEVLWYHTFPKPVFVTALASRVPGEEMFKLITQPAYGATGKLLVEWMALKEKRLGSKLS